MSFFFDNLCSENTLHVHAAQTVEKQTLFIYKKCLKQHLEKCVVIQLMGDK